MSPKNRPRAKTDLYKEAGVDIVQGDAVVDWLQMKKSAATATPYGKVVSGIGGFAGLFRPNFKKFKDPLLIASTDGVGTKLLLGLSQGKLTGLGQDLVAMCVNDLYTLGGRPLFFLDYYATGKLNPTQFKAVVSGIKSACDLCSIPLLGGETAELPGLYEKNHFDLAGFVIGVTDGKRHLGPHLVKAGDRLYALEGSGFHSNGYSVIRKWVSEKAPSAAVMTRLLEPTQLYHSIPDLFDELGLKSFHALANITGGGVSGNLPRVIPAGLNAHIEASALPTPKWMADFIKGHGAQLSDVEHVFNLGAGMIAIVARAAGAEFESAARRHGLKVHPIGDVRKGRGEARVIYQ